GFARQTRLANRVVRALTSRSIGSAERHAPRKAIVEPDAGRNGAESTNDIAAMLARADALAARGTLHSQIAGTTELPPGSVWSALRAPCAARPAHVRSRADRHVPQRRARSGPAPNPGLYQSEYGRWPRTALARASAR